MWFHIELWLRYSKPRLYTKTYCVRAKELGFTESFWSHKSLGNLIYGYNSMLISISKWNNVDKATVGHLPNNAAWFMYRKSG